MSNGTKGGLTVDVKGFKRWVEAFAKEYGFDAKDIMKDQMRLWQNQAVKVTPPPTFKKGRDAVKRDINKLFVPLDKQQALDFFEEQFFDNQLLPSSVLFNKEGNINRMKGWHQSRRRGGKVRYKSSIVKRLAGVEFVNEMYVPKRKLNAYIRARQKNVGLLKAGWGPGVDMFGGKLPAFAQKQRRRTGDAQDRMKRDGSGFLESVNAVPWASQRIGRAIEATAATRIRDLTTHLDKRVQTLAKKFERRSV